MKRALLLLPSVLLSVAPVIAQERPRPFDNFDTRSGVRVQAPEPKPQQMSTTGRQLVAERKARPASKHYLPSPPHGDQYKNRVYPERVERTYVMPTSLVAMRVNEGYSQRESYRSAEAARLIMGTGNQLRGHSTGDDLVDAYIVDSSRRYRIDPLLIYAQMGQESSFKPRALSHKGASGLMQLMPATARRLGVTNIYDPKQNIEGGVKYMRILLDMFNGDVNLALAGYNAGEGAVIKYGYQIPPYNETRDYVRRISARYKVIANANISRNGR